MSFLNAGQAIQRFLYNQRYNTPDWESIWAVLNARMFNTTIQEETSDFLNGPGKLRQLKVSYYPIQCDVVDEDTSINICAAGTEQEPIQNFYTISKLLKSKTYSLDPSNLRYVDGEFEISTHGVNQIATILGALEKELAIQITTDIIANKGVHQDGSEFGNRVTASNTTNGLMTPIGFWQIEKEQNDLAYTNTFYLGHTEVYNWKKAYEIATENTYLGQDFRKLAIDHLYYDTNLNSIMSVDPSTDGEYILTFTPQALKFVSWNRNAGMWATSIADWSTAFDRLMKEGKEQVVKTTFKSPNYDLLWDFYLHYTPCVDGSYDGRYDWHFELNWDILYTPVQACNAQGINGIMLYRTCPVVVPACPTGTALSPAVDESEYSWTPGDIFPLTVSNLAIGGQQSYPNEAITNIAGLVALLNNSYSPNTLFEVSGSDIVYDGYTALTGSINGSITITFA